MHLPFDFIFDRVMALPWCKSSGGAWCSACSTFINVNWYPVWDFLPSLAHMSRRLTKWAYSIPMVHPLSTLLNIYSSETPGPIQVRFYVEHLCLAGTKVYIIGPGHMTKMAALPIYGKKHLKVFYSRQQKGLEPCKCYINDDPGLTYTYFMARSNFCPKGVWIGKR